MTAPATGTTPSGGEGGTAPTVTSPVPASVTTPPAVPAATAPASEAPKLGNSAIDAIVARKGGNYRRVIRDLLVDNHEYRTKLDKAVSLPDGGVVLTKDQAAQWAAYQALGKAPDAIRTVLTEHNTWSTERAEKAQRDSVEGLARTAGYNPALLFRVAKADGLRIEARTVTERENGKQVQYTVLHVVEGEGDKAKATPLDEYRTAHWADVLPEPEPLEEGEEGGEPDDQEDTSSTSSPAPVTTRAYPPQRTTAPVSRTSGRQPSVQAAVKSQLDRLYKPKKAAT